jgi:hypothetical protein
MTVKLYDEVVLGRDVPEDGLKAGDIATLVDLVPGPAGQPQGAVLEVFNALGQTICITSVSVTDIHPLTADEILSARPLSRAG